VVHDATVNIKAKRKYTATGDYDYVDETKRPSRSHACRMGDTAPIQTYARGRIPQDQGFQLSPAFDYFGDVLIKASVKELTFSGNTRILHDCPGLTRKELDGFHRPGRPQGRVHSGERYAHGC
jgi:hypothetical protein